MASQPEGTRSRRVASAASMALLLAMLFAPVSVRAQASGGPIGDAPDAAAVMRSLETVKADPNLGGQRKVRTLRFRGTSGNSAIPQVPPWLQRLAAWLAQSTRYVVWFIAFVGAALLAAYLVRVARAESPGDDDMLSLTPSHVRDLDIRPESLPRDVGAAARDLWESGEQRAALSLLYRGMLSRLVHVHHLPIRASSTEGDCLRLSAGTLAAEQRDYVASLIRVWQQSVYGHLPPETERVLALCAQFDTGLTARGDTSVGVSAVA